MKEKKRSAFSISMIWIVIATLAGILIIGDLNRRMANARRLERDAAQLQTEVAALEESNQELETQIAGATEEAQVAQWARAEAKMVLKGERLVVPIPDPDAVPTPTPSLTEEQRKPSKWEIWLALLAGN